MAAISSSSVGHPNISADKSSQPQFINYCFLSRNNIVLMEPYVSSDVFCGAVEGIFLLKCTEISEQVRDVLVKVEQDSLESLVLIDTIQRFGLGYLFKDEIEATLQQHYLAAESAIYNDHHDLYKASLCFRLLRQQGFQVHADDFFRGFKGEDGEFKSKDGLISDTKGVLAMYEASHLSMEGEDILHEAAIFSSHHLHDKLRWLDDEQAIMVKHCLMYPQHKSLSLFTAEKFLQSLNGENGWENLLQELAKLEFSTLESLHKHEILQVVKWWRGLRLSNEVKSSRNQPLKWHMWSMATLRNPIWSKHRILLTKPISLVYAVDDIFDLYGTIDDLTLFTEAVNRWDISTAEQLPSYMKTCFIAIYDTTDEISHMVSQEYGWNPIESLRKEWGSLFNAFLVEAKWFTSGELPKAEEYLKNGVISSGVPMVLSHLFFLMGNPLTKEAEIQLSDPQGFTYSVAKILRLLDDLGTAQDEHQEGYDGSYVECYMKEEHVHSLEDAHEHVMAMVSDTWVNLNKHGLCSTSAFSASFRQACLNAARMVPTMYNYDNDHRLPLLEQYIKSMFRDTAFTKSFLA